MEDRSGKLIQNTVPKYGKGKLFSDIANKWGTCRERMLSLFQRSEASHMYHDCSLIAYWLSCKKCIWSMFV